MNLPFIALIEILGTVSFVISGIRLASGKQIDWFGAYIIGLVTAIGGGTVRDILLNVTPFWMLDAKYFLTSAVVLVAVLILKDRIFRLGSTLFLFDAIGLGLFTVVGISKSIDAGLPFWVCIAMGAITGSVGGVLRDILLNDVPLLFRKEIYALASIAGGILYFLCSHFGLPSGLTEFIAAGTVIVIRLIATKFHVHLPQLSLSTRPQT